MLRGILLGDFIEKGRYYGKTGPRHGSCMIRSKYDGRGLKICDGTYASVVTSIYNSSKCFIRFPLT